ncbi:MAG: DedA family protein [Acidimicrobiales bacterium]
MIERILEGLAGLDTHWFLLLTFFLPFGETVAFLDAVVPGEVGLVFVGAAADDAGISLLVVIAVATAGAFAGDSTSWFIGHRWGTAALTKWEPIRRHTEKPLAKAEAHFDKYGGQTVFAARFVGALRAVVPLVAGTSGMTYRQFVPWNAAASAVWVTAMILLGAAFGEAVASAVDRFGIAITAIVVTIVVGLYVRYRIRKRREALAPEDPSLTDPDPPEGAQG